MVIRPAVRAGSFYDASPEACRRHVEQLAASAELPADLPGRLYGGLVPHAGWVYSGRLAAMTFKALLAGGGVETFVLLGADHTGDVQTGEVWPDGAWETPLGKALVNEELAAALLAGCKLLRANPAAHAREHSLEVQVPIIQALAPDANIVPIAVPPTGDAVAIGQAVGEILADKPAGRVCVVGSTDLTHHGGHFGHPGGRGEKSEAYARANDRRMLDLIEAMDAQAVVPEAMRHHNACGAGAVAAAVAAAQARGATAGRLLAYTNSYEITHKQYPHELDDTTVGYASVVFV
ncbi:MAG: AmmeMemoRadiSam system protein B [Phycisphaerae bacterium]|nr:AmmeMemoRadiSam system protein B [Phycisphaerae bacterium]